MPLRTVSMEILPTGMLPILTIIMQVLPTGMLPILTSMIEGVPSQFNLAKDDSDDGLVAL